MPLFVVEREFAEAFDPDDETLRLVDEYNAEHDIVWMSTFLSADRKKTYCLFECADLETIRQQAADLGMPADVITPVEEFAR